MVLIKVLLIVFFKYKSNLSVNIGSRYDLARNRRWTSIWTNADCKLDPKKISSVNWNTFFYCNYVVGLNVLMTFK